MRGLLRRLSEVDSEAEAALRVIQTFDALVQHRASLEALARTTSGLTRCPVGIELIEDRRCIRVDSHGKTLSAAAAPGSCSEVVVAGNVVARCWLERHGDLEVHDEIILERLVVACASIWSAQDSAARRPAVELAVSLETSDQERGRALRQLGFGEAVPLRVVVFAEPGGSSQLDPGRRAQVHRALQQSTPARTAILGRRGVVLQDGHRPLPDGVEGMRISVGPVVPAMQAPTSWREACDILDLSMGLPLLVGPVADSASVGSMLALTSVPAECRSSNPDVQALVALARSHDEDLQCLEAFLATGSLRAAGGVLHRHHSSVANRLARVEEVLGLDLGSPSGAARAVVALVLLRLPAASLPTPVAPYA